MTQSLAENVHNILLWDHIIKHAYTEKKKKNTNQPISFTSPSVV